ncbi:MAG: general secretion pathway protein GspC, partial [Bdellovibrio sp.]
MTLLDSASYRLSQFLRSKKRPPFEGAYIYILTLALGYFAADLSILQLRPSMLPNKPPPRPHKSRRMVQKSFTEYKVIENQNIFNPDGKIPPALSEKGKNQFDEKAPAVPSNLPLQLLGTIVATNPKMSIASILVKTKNKSNAYMVGDHIEDMAEVIKIERKKVTIRNLNNRRLEYIEIPENMKLSFSAPSASHDGVIEPVGKNEYSLKRTEVEKYLEDLPSLMRPDVVRMMPNRTADGRIDGFRFTRIKPGSVYDKLGFQVGDVLKSSSFTPSTDLRT